MEAMRGYLDNNTCCLDAWVNRALLDPALAALLSGTPLDAPIAFLAVRSAPRILDLPILLASIGAIAHNEHPMIEVFAASFVCQDAARVVLEDSLVCLNCDRDGLLRHSGLERSFRLAYFGGASHVPNSDDLGASP